MQGRTANPVGLEGLLELLPKTWPPSDIELIERAYTLAAAAHDGQVRASGEAYIHHPLAVASILAELNLDPATIAAGLLHDVAEDSQYNIQYIEEHFGPEVARLVDGVTKLEQIDELRKPAESLQDEKAESLRKMFLAMVDDVRVVLIKLADRLHNMRTLSSLPEHKRRRIARETLEIFAPLANRLGIWQIKWELEDLAFRHLEPATYKELARKIQERRQDREQYINQVIQTLQDELRKAGIQAEVSGRPKHIYSIWRKMKRKGVDFDQIYDAQGVRIIVNSVLDCYAALGVVHSLWRPIPGEIDDYIATPKDNMYRSLHTAVVGPNGRPMEVQIRTWEMHRTAEYGIAAHWRYKEQGGKRDIDFENKIAWLRQLMEWRQEVTDAQEFVDSMKTDVFQDRVYTFTPQGDVIDLPAGSTPIDFAYHVHTEVGHRCRGARVNGKLVPLDYQLRNGDQVEIITAKRGGPSRDWLNPNLGFVKTQRARGKIRQWFRRLDREVNIAEGRQILDKELKRLSVEISYDAIAKMFNFESVDDLLAAIGYGDINPQQIAAKVLEVERKDQSAPLPEPAHKQRPTIPMDGVSVQGVSGLLTHPAHCCNPLPGDDIIGYVTRGRGVSIHKRDCPNVLLTREPERLIEVSWGTQPQQTYPVSIIVHAFDRAGLLRDIASVVADEKVNMREAQAITGLKDNTAIITATLDVTGVVQLSRLLTKIEQLPNVVEARRRVG
ncbi:MAG: GTP diphosphokinase [Anaerolineae bacterium]|nr:GTP diphosphokinase [Anaerolineae bacterium]MDW8099969.1 GTP diphosphokinase [Anaerolineae bacterium]